MEAIHSRRDGGVLVLEIDRTAKRNAIDLAMFGALADALCTAQEQAEIRAVLLCGAGDGFTAGHDLQAFAQWPQAANDPVPRFLHALAGLRKPLVIAVHGWAIGIGATALLHADWVLADADAMLRFPFVDLDIAPEAGASLLLAPAIGTLRARQLLLGGGTITAREACAWGLVTELVPRVELRGAAMARARELAAKPQGMVRRIKDWLAPADALHARIDEEIDAINQAVRARRLPAKPEP
jgi:enoyl-CoA hydratase/carnithine racemase